jgi:hypothetical protein
VAAQTNCTTLQDKNIGTARFKAFAVPFEMAFKASEDVRHLNVDVVAS